MAKSFIANEIIDEVPGNKDTVTLVFREPRKFELHIGRESYVFSGQEPREVPRSILSHHDFTDEIKNLFLVRE